MSKLDNEDLMPAADWQTQYRGTNSAEYEIYTSFSDDKPLKTYEEWINS